MIKILIIYNTSTTQLTLDSLLRVLKTQANDDSIKVDLLSQIAYAYYRVDADSTIYFAYQSKLLAKKINYPVGIGRALIRLSIGYWAKGEYNKTIQFAQEAITIFEKYNHQEEISLCYNAIGLVYYRKKQYNKALEYFEKGFAIDKIYDYKKNMGVKLTNMGIIYEAMKDYDKALTYFYESLSVNEKIGFELFIPLTLRHIGEVYFKKQDYVKAEFFGNKALNVTKRIGDDRDMALAYLLLGKIAQVRTKNQKAEFLLLKSFEYAQKSKEKEHGKEIAEVLYLFYKAQKNDNKALKYHELFKIYQDSLSSKKIETEVKDLEFSYQIKTKEKEINVLKKDKVLQEDVSKTQKLFIISVLFVALLISLLAFIFFNGRKKQEKANILLRLQNKEILETKEELLIQTQKLQETNEQKDKLFSIISHDLRSPLNSLQGLLGLISLEGITPQEAEELYKNINQQLNGLQNTLANLLQWAKSQIAKEEPIKEKFNLHQLIAENVNLLQMIAINKQIKLSNEVPIDIELYADTNQVRTVFRNLIANAIKFTNNGGQIVIKASKIATYIEIHVQDNGIGMTEKQIEKLFNTKTHFSTRGTSGEKGTGLGLIFTKDFIEKNGGTIKVVSTEGVGTDFVVKLPNG